MLTIINLYAINKIFTEDAQADLSPLAKMLYINCLTHHFKDKQPSVANAVAFDIFINDIKGYDKFQHYFEELHKAGLVAITFDRVSFANAWGRHIDRSKLNNVNPNTYVAGFTFSSPEEFKNELIGNRGLLELSGMKYKINERQVEFLITLFVKEQTTLEKKYINLADCTKHFIYWIPANIDKAPKENVKSTNKLLGE